MVLDWIATVPPDAEAWRWKASASGMRRIVFGWIVAGISWVRRAPPLVAGALRQAQGSSYFRLHHFGRDGDHCRRSCALQIRKRRPCRSVATALIYGKYQ